MLIIELISLIAVIAVIILFISGVLKIDRNIKRRFYLLLIGIALMVLSFFQSLILNQFYMARASLYIVFAVRMLIAAYLAACLIIDIIKKIQLTIDKAGMYS